MIDSNGQASSIRGQTPAVNVSLIDAMTACESTQIDGENLRLATVQEWQDAGDGVLGAGGTPYPWGSIKDDSRCVVDSPHPDDGLRSNLQVH